MGVIERAIELEDFAVYCETVVLNTAGDQRYTWQERAKWARDCAADFRGAVSALRAIGSPSGKTAEQAEKIARDALVAMGLPVHPGGGQ